MPAPTRLTGADYPDLVPQGRAIDTVAVGSVLAVAELKQLQERYRNVANFVDVFFTGFQSLSTRTTRSCPRSRGSTGRATPWPTASR